MEKAQIFDSFTWVYLFWNIEGLSWDPDECGTEFLIFMDDNKSPGTYYLYVQHTGLLMDDLPIHVISSVQFIRTAHSSIQCGSTHCGPLPRWAKSTDLRPNVVNLLLNPLRAK
ncbi:hypothetical protein cypCar_00019497 [Cyprinus carpio]|nr:hypothetical protein cypCar_00019497 [Cyprinus carpio]